MGAIGGPNIIQDGLVLVLDAASYISYPGSGTTWYDLSGNDNHGTLVGNSDYVTWNSNGYFEHNPGDLYFGAPDSNSAASTNSGSYWNIPSDSSLNPNNGWTVSGVMNVLGGQSGNGCGWFVMDDLDLRIHLEPITNNFRANASDGWSQINSTITSYHNTFAQYTFVYTQTSGTYGTDPGSITFYINGNLVQTDTSFTPTLTTDFQISLGRRRGHWGHFINANIVNYHYYNRSLSETEIQGNFNEIKKRFEL